MLQPVNLERVYKFVGKDIDKDNDLPTDNVGEGSEAYDATTGKTYIFVGDTWEEKV